MRARQRDRDRGWRWERRTQRASSSSFPRAPGAQAGIGTSPASCTTVRVPWCAADGCRGFIGPVPLPLWMSKYDCNVRIGSWLVRLATRDGPHEGHLHPNSWGEGALHVSADGV